MPTTYAHDLFGKKVYRQLPEEMRKVIRENGELYRIGQHGPDILFYFMMSRKITGTGTRMHHEKARDFFERGMEIVRRDQDRSLLAYLLGFGCHYLLDSTCHPYVNQMARKGVITHTLLEKEFDRSLMLETGKNPYRFYPSHCIVPRRKYARVIHQVMPEISVWKIQLSLVMMKVITNTMVYDNRGKRLKLLHLVTWPAGAKRSRTVLDHFMTEEPAKNSGVPVRELRELYQKAAEEAPAELEKLFALSKEEGSLSGRWDRTYSG